jgi:hypothetical protein
VLSGLADHPAATGVVSAGTVYAGYAPAGKFTLTQGGRTVARQPAFGWAAQFPGASAGSATLSLRQFPTVPLLVLVELLSWVALAAALLGWLRSPRRRRAAAAAGSTPTVAPDGDTP